MYPTSIFQSAELSIDDKNKLNMVINHLLFLMRIKSVSLYEHSQRVSNLAAATAIYMRLTANEITLIAMPACFMTSVSSVYPTMC